MNPEAGVKDSKVTELANLLSSDIGSVYYVPQPRIYWAIFLADEVQMVEAKQRVESEGCILD